MGDTVFSLILRDHSVGVLLKKNCVGGTSYEGPRTRLGQPNIKYWKLHE